MHNDNAILLSYQERILSLHAAASQLRLGQMLALALMIGALVAVLLLAFSAVARRSFPVPYCLLPLPLAIYMGRVSRRRNRGLLETLRLETWYRQGVDRLEGNWAGNGVRGEEFVPAGHPYAKDLGIRGRVALRIAVYLPNRSGPPRSRTASA